MMLAIVAHTPALVMRHRSVSTYQGSFADGATYLIESPSNWNGTLLIYSHGYTAPGKPNRASDASGALTGAYLLDQGYALGGSSYASTGWAVQQALPDQVEVLGTFASLVGQPARTVAWGDSMGGLVTAALVQQYPSLFSGALPMCGIVGGGVGFWNTLFDSGFAFNTLVASDQLQAFDIADPTANLSSALTYLEAAQGSAQGQARIALSAALAEEPGWFGKGPQPPPTDYADQEIAQYDWLLKANFLFTYDLRAELEGRAGGNPSGNVGVDYRRELLKSGDLAEVRALYATAGLSLDADLDALENAPRVAPDPGALQYLTQNIIFDGQISVPVLSLHTEGDGLVVNQNESAYSDAIDAAGLAGLHRRLFVDRAGHCAFTPGEQIAAFQALIERLDSGTWRGLDPASLNAAALALGSAYNPKPPHYAQFEPRPFLRTDNGTP